MQNDSILLAFVAIAAAALFLQTVLLFALFLSLRKAARRTIDQVEELRSAVTPVILTTRDLLSRIAPKIEATVETTRDLVTRVSPRVESAVSEMAEIAHGLKTQVAELQSTADEVMESVRKQSHRVDSMVTGVLDTVDRAGGVVADAVRKPLRQISGVVASIRAAVESLRTPPVAQGRTHAPSDKDMFI